MITAQALEQHMLCSPPHRENSKAIAVEIAIALSDKDHEKQTGNLSKNSSVNQQKA